MSSVIYVYRELFLKSVGTAKNLRILRDSLHLSQSQMAAALGGFTQSTYNMWERGSQPPQEVRQTLNVLGINLNWLETGEGEMLKMGVERIQVVRDEKTGKAISLKGVTLETPANIGQKAAPYIPAGFSAEDISAAWVLIHEACTAAGARPDLMPAKGLGRLLAIVAEKISRGEGFEARSAILEEAKDLVVAMSGQVR